MLKENRYEENIDYVDWDVVWSKEEESENNTSVNVRPSSNNNSKKTSGKLRLFSGSSKKKARKRKKGLLKKIALWAVALLSIYSILIYSSVPFIAKWRTIYIETAMSTMRYQWLATAFIPGNIIDDVMRNRYLLDEAQAGLVSDWDSGIGFMSQRVWESNKNYFLRVFHEIDESSFDKYIKENDAYNKNDRVFVDKAGLDDDGTSIKTKNGDQVLAIDEEQGILIVKIKGGNYVARLAIIKDPSQVKLGLAENFGSYGSSMERLVKSNGAILGVNASGFVDPNGMGNGGKAYGLVISDGKMHQKLINEGNRVIALDYHDRLNIGKFQTVSSFRDAVEFKPALIINGEKLVRGSAGWGIQPRTVIGQTKKGEILLLIVDGRAPGYSIGATLGECADIMESYGAVQACNLDGGSSSIMYYNGREISKPSAANKKKGRAVPNGFLVFPK